jgi:hypothetical protein
MDRLGLILDSAGTEPEADGEMPTPSKRARTEGPEADERDVGAIVAALRAKPDWQRKVADPEVARCYALEARQQGASEASVAVAFQRLLAAAVTPANTLSTPAVRLDENDECDDSAEDDDYRQDEEALESGVWTERTIVGGDGVKQRVRQRSDIQAISYVDGAVPDELRTKLEAALDAIANSTDKDFHPGSNEMVRLCLRACACECACACAMIDGVV